MDELKLQILRRRHPFLDVLDCDPEQLNRIEERALSDAALNVMPLEYETRIKGTQASRSDVWYAVFPNSPPVKFGMPLRKSNIWGEETEEPGETIDFSLRALVGDRGYPEYVVNYWAETEDNRAGYRHKEVVVIYRCENCEELLG